MVPGYRTRLRYFIREASERDEEIRSQSSENDALLKTFSITYFSEAKSNDLSDMLGLSVTHGPRVWVSPPLHYIVI